MHMTKRWQRFKRMKSAPVCIQVLGFYRFRLEIYLNICLNRVLKAVRETNSESSYQIHFRIQAG